MYYIIIYIYITWMFTYIYMYIMYAYLLYQDKVQQTLHGDTVVVVVEMFKAYIAVACETGRRKTRSVKAQILGCSGDLASYFMFCIEGTQSERGHQTK